MKNLLLVTVVLFAASGLHANPTAQSLFLEASQLEQQSLTQEAIAKYSEVIRQFPQSDLAMKADERRYALTQGSTEEQARSHSLAQGTDQPIFSCPQGNSVCEALVAEAEADYLRFKISRTPAELVKIQNRCSDWVPGATSPEWKKAGFKACIKGYLANDCSKPVFDLDPQGCLDDNKRYALKEPGLVRF